MQLYSRLTKLPTPLAAAADFENARSSFVPATRNAIPEFIQTQAKNNENKTKRAADQRTWKWTRRT
eukprot:m.1469306 g.1469306  ORF g.1469306 m.1469306 type:complete len:66 (+) comp25141_c0_seq7:355-552(+)